MKNFGLRLNIEKIYIMEKLSDVPIINLKGIKN